MLDRELDSKYRVSALMQAVEVSKARVTSIVSGAIPPSLKISEIIEVADEFYEWFKNPGEKVFYNTSHPESTGDKEKIRIPQYIQCV